MVVEVTHLVKAEELDVVKKQDELLSREKCDLLNVSRFLDRTLWDFLKYASFRSISFVNILSSNQMISMVGP